MTGYTTIAGCIPTATGVVVLYQFSGAIATVNTTDGLSTRVFNPVTLAQTRANTVFLANTTTIHHDSLQIFRVTHEHGAVIGYRRVFRTDSTQTDQVRALLRLNGTDIANQVTTSAGVNIVSGARLPNLIGATTLVTAGTISNFVSYADGRGIAYSVNCTNKCFWSNKK